MGKPEAVIENYLVTQCKKFQIMCLKFTAQGNNGVPDRILIGHGQTVFVETKGVEGAPRRLQQEVIDTMIRHGATVRVVRTKDHIDDLIIEIIRKKPPGE